MKTLEKQALFWDVNLAELDAQKHKNFIAKRILSMGDFDDLQWAIKAYSLEFLRNIFLKSATQLDAKSQNFWNIYFNLSAENICTLKQSTNRQSMFLKR
jgi:hypothetical protein